MPLITSVTLDISKPEPDPVSVLAAFTFPVAGVIANRAAAARPAILTFFIPMPPYLNVSTHSI